MEYSLSIWLMYTMYNNQITIITISISLNIYHFFVLGTFELL